MYVFDSREHDKENIKFECMFEKVGLNIVLI